MNEVEKLYSLAGVEPDYDYFTLFDDKVHKIGRTMHLCKEELKHWLENYQKDYVAIKVIRVDKDYPPFTAEKQLELIKLIANRKGYPDYEYFGTLFDDYVQFLEFDEALARLVNDLWQDLTEEECKQIKGILE